MNPIRIGWSNFALGRHKAGTGHSYFQGAPEEVVKRVLAAWEQRQPGYGRTTLTEVVVVPVAPEGFVGTTATVEEGDTIQSKVTRRREGENVFIENTAAKDADPARFVRVVLYSRQTLQGSGETLSGDYDWEIVSIMASGVENEPMHPLTMARNFLRQPGGTFAPYTAEQFAEAIWYWADKAKVSPQESGSAHTN